VNAVLDTTTYDRGIKITDRQITALEATQLRRHEFHGDWNYTLTADHIATRPTKPT
jgi:Rhodopirellula transposase.